MKKMIITGAGGFLGERVAAYYKEKDYKVIPCDHSALDITDKHAVINLFSQEKPQAVIHCAAISDTGYAQVHPDISEKVNLLGTRNIALASMKFRAKLIYMSSDQVYTGNAEKYPLPEDIVLNPENIYGCHKLRAEQDVTSICPTAVGLRLTWMYDRPDSQYRLNQNLLVNLRQAAQTGVPLKGATGELRGITYVWDVVTRLETCLELPGGVYNFGCENLKSTYETLCEAATLCGYDEKQLIQQDNIFVRNLSMDITKLRNHGIDFPDTLEGLTKVLA